MSDKKRSCYFTRKIRNLLQESSDPSHRAITNSDMVNKDKIRVLGETYNVLSSSTATSNHHDRNEINEIFTDKVLFTAPSITVSMERLTNCIKNGSFERGPG